MVVLVQIPCWGCSWRCSCCKRGHHGSFRPLLATAHLESVAVALHTAVVHRSSSWSTHYRKVHIVEVQPSSELYQERHPWWSVARSGEQLECETVGTPPLERVSNAIIRVAAENDAVTPVFKIGVGGCSRLASPFAKIPSASWYRACCEGAVLQYAEAAFHLHSVVAAGEGQSSVKPIGLAPRYGFRFRGWRYVGHCAEVKYRCLARVGEQTDGILAAWVGGDSEWWFLVFIGAATHITGGCLPGPRPHCLASGSGLVLVPALLSLPVGDRNSCRAERLVANPAK